MTHDFGYGYLENKLIHLFRSGAPDFEAAEQLIKQGADLNAVCNNKRENILSEIILGYWETQFQLPMDLCEECENTSCDACSHRIELNPYPGPALCSIIQFFLEHGFNVNNHDGSFGAQCLHALALSTFDRYMIDAVKMLIDAGAKNLPVSNNDDSTPWDFIALEGSAQRTCYHDYHTANVYEAIYQIYQAINDGRPYRGIHSYENAIGKKIQKVLIPPTDGFPSFFSLELPLFKKNNCYNQNIYFVYDGGVLISTQHMELWTDTSLPATDILDVSERFQGIVGNIIEEISFEHSIISKGSLYYGQPIINIKMSSGCKIKFSTNYGEVKKDNLAAYYEFL